MFGENDVLIVRDLPENLASRPRLAGANEDENSPHTRRGQTGLSKRRSTFNQPG